MSSTDTNTNTDPITNSPLKRGLSPATKAGGRRIPAAHPHPTKPSEHAKEEAELLKQDLLEHKNESMEHQKHEIEAAKQEAKANKSKAIAANFQPPPQKHSNKAHNHHIQQPGGGQAANKSY